MLELSCAVNLTLRKGEQALSMRYCPRQPGTTMHPNVQERVRRIQALREDISQVH